MATDMTGNHPMRAEVSGVALPHATVAAPPTPTRRNQAARDPEIPADGQLVIVAARWVLVLSGLVLALWNPGPIGQIRLHVFVLLLLAVGNFYLHAQLLMRRPALSGIAYAASAVDIATITLLVISQGGFASPLYIFYFPAILAFSVAFPISKTVGFAATAVAVYACVGLFSANIESEVQSLIVRLLMLAAAAVCGGLFSRIEAGRQRVVSSSQEAAEDIFFGQAVIIWARWFVILTGAILTLWTAATIAEITINTLLIVVLMGVNFFLHGRYLTGRPANRLLLVAVSAIDLLIITGIVVAWQGQVGLASQFFVFYYPVVLAFAFVLPPRATAIYTAAALAAYTGACLLAGSVVDTADAKLLTMRLITLAAMGGLGTFYWRTQRERRRKALRAPAAFEELQTKLAAPLP